MEIKNIDECETINCFKKYTFEQILPETILYMRHIKIIECPRDAMQGFKRFIPTEDKIAYQNALLKCNFDTLDFGSFVSEKAIPQMKDTHEVYEGLNLENSKTKLLAIVANDQGIKNALLYKNIQYLGFPFSISETFQQRNTNSSIEDSFELLNTFVPQITEAKKEMVVYISMGFGNPYNDEWNEEIVLKWVSKIASLGVNIISLSDTIGIAKPDQINSLYKVVTKEFPALEIGAHLHTQPYNWREKIDAAFEAGCNRYDGALKGFGGCPMATEELTGNMPTENLVQYFEEKNIETGIDKNAFLKCMSISGEIFY